MGSRTRSLAVPNNPGTMLINGATVQGKLLDQIWAKADDVTGNRNGENPCNIRKSQWKATPLNGKIITKEGNQIGECQAYWPEGLYEVIDLAPTTSDSALVPAVLSRSNPSRPYVDTGVFLGELRDFPAMGKALWDTAKRVVKDAPKDLSRIKRLDYAFKRAARDVFVNGDEYFIATQFGYLPFVSDVVKYCNAGEVVQKRYEELKNLKASGTSFRRVTLDSEMTHSLDPKYRLSSLGVSFYGELATANSYKRWGVGKWKLTPGGPLDRAMTDSKVLALARSAVYGATVDASTAWNLMPWSWLIDWASNAGDWIESSRNLVGAQPEGKTCIMTNGIGLWSCRRKPGIHDDWFSVSGGTFEYVYERKMRTVHANFDMPQLTIPILSGRQTAILGSLMTMRARGRDTKFRS